MTSRSAFVPAVPAPPALSLAAIATNLQRPRERIETLFFAVGSRLTQSATLLGRISSVFGALPAQLESSELLEATDRLQALADQARSMAATFAAEQQHIARLAEVVERAQRPIHDLQRTVKMIGIVAVNARVTAAGIIDEMDGFDVFTSDISDLSESATRTVRTFAENYRRLLVQVLQADAQRHRSDSSHDRTLGALADRVQSCLADMTERRHAAAAGSVETSRLSMQIAGRVAAAVSAMQIGDTTRQRVEHVEAALATMDALAGNAAALPLLSHLQASLLDSAADAFDGEVVTAGRALEELATDAGGIVAHSRTLYGDADGGANSSIAALGAELRLATTILRRCEAERAQLDAIAAEVGSTVAILLDHVEAVQDIEFSMRLVSLNAAVKCAQLGPRGRALDVIAHQLRQLTGETVVSADAAMATLEEAAGLAEAFVGSATSEATSQVARLEEEARASIELLATVDRRLSDALASLAEDAPQAASLLQSAAGEFGAHAAISAALAAASERLRQEAEEMPPPEVLVRSAALLDQLRSRYTMDSERRLHDELTGTKPTAPVAASHDKVDEEGDEDALDALFF